jgi:hypothetical protein
MAINARLTSTNGVLEKNAVTYPRTGNIMAMFPLDETVAKAENGMLLGVNYSKGVVEYPSTTSDAIMILDSAEKEYDINKAGLNQHYLTPSYGYMPRLGKLEINDRFTTSSVAYDSSVYADVEAIATAVENGTAIYGKACKTEGYKGLIELTTASVASEKVGLKVEKVTTLPNGEPAIKFAVIAA